MDEKLWVLEDYLQVKGLTKSFAPLIIELFRFINLDGKVLINASLKRDMGSRIQATVGSIDNMITKLVEGDVLTRVDRGMYVFNIELNELVDTTYKKLTLKVEYQDDEKKITIDTGGKNKWVYQILLKEFKM